ncbi:hypothetical protein AAEX37_01723 [Oligella sp. MSHR50489EDL]|uniref:hypothetical protein n=1 Tax=Oligella sp. MSHR50489EDL TaxID=3139409 RepID=UPI003D818372
MKKVIKYALIASLFVSSPALAWNSQPTVRLSTGGTLPILKNDDGQTIGRMHNHIYINPNSKYKKINATTSLNFNQLFNGLGFGNIRITW